MRASPSTTRPDPSLTSWLPGGYGLVLLRFVGFERAEALVAVRDRWSIRWRRLSIPALALMVAAPLLGCEPARVVPPPSPAPLWAKYVGTQRELAPNAGWCWWQSRRAVISGNTLLVGSVPNKRGANGTTLRTQVLSMNLDTKTTKTANLAVNPYRDDDHNSPGLVVNPGGSVTAGFTGHGYDGTIRLRQTTSVSQNTWSALPNLTPPPHAGANLLTYDNLVRSEGLLWSFSRRDNRTWAAWSADEGQTWNGAWMIFEGTWAGGEQALQRPYVMFTANPAEGRIDFVTTRGHPKDIRDGGLYSGYLKGMNVYRTDGTLLGPLGTGPGYRQIYMTPVFVPPPNGHPVTDEPFSDQDLWGSDLITDAQGEPVVTFSLREPDASPVPGKLYRHWYYWAKWNGTAWSVTRVSAAGSELFGSETDYTGLISVDPSDPYRVVMSSDVHPVTSAPLVSAADDKVHYELFEGRSVDSGATWSWRPITENSTADNIRPVLATEPSGRWALVWMKGIYSNWLSWDMKAMVISGTTSTARPPAVVVRPPIVTR